jgi:addiction module HigA family antidote
MTRINTHPGEVLREEFLHPLGMSARALAREIDVPPNRVTGIVNEERDVSADTAIRLGKFFGTSAEFWLGLQRDYDLAKALAGHDYAKVHQRMPVAA